MLAVALDAFFKEVGTVDGLIAAGDHESHLPAQRRAYLVTVVPC